ncbi:MAG: hypothetical protein M1814_003505 [Vezdaea aestivalis]|nr:MAG: hypothetical protein M1814_003505 [Vezdaea aestivalis]
MALSADLTGEISQDQKGKNIELSQSTPNAQSVLKDDQKPADTKRVSRRSKRIAAQRSQTVDAPQSKAAPSTASTVNVHNQAPLAPSWDDDALTSQMSKLGLGQGDRIKSTAPPPPIYPLASKSPTSLPVPIPTTAYLEQSSLPPIDLSFKATLLIILDLNGTLLYRPNRKRQPKAFSPRPDVYKFLSYILSTHRVMVWSSATYENVSAMCRQLLPTKQDHERLVTIWGRQTFNLTPEQYREKTQVYKVLEQVWDSEEVQNSCPSGEWNQTNTVLIDDSMLKGCKQPHNLLQIPEFQGTDPKGKSVLELVKDYLEEVRAKSDVSSYMRSAPFRIDEQKS